METTIQVKVEKLPKSTVKLTIDASPADLAAAMDRSYAKLSPGVEVKGFRKGKAPQNLIIEALGTKLYTTAVSNMMWDLLQKALEQEHIDPISNPEFSMEETAATEGMQFSVSFAVYPAVTIGDLTKVKVDQEETKKAKEAREKIEEHGHIHEEGDTHEKSLETEQENAFNLETYYSNIIDQVIHLTALEVPDILIETELENHIKEFSNRLSQLGITLPQYLDVQKKTEEEVKEMWKKDIKFSIEQEFILMRYASDNHIEASEEEIKESIAAVYPNQNPATIDKGLYNYVRSAIIKQKAFMALITFIENNNTKNDTNTNSN